MIINKLKNRGSLIIENTDKFKDLAISVRFYFDLTPNNANNAVVLSNILGDKTVSCPSKQALREACDSLYGALLETRFQVIGNTGALTVSTQVINGKYLGKNIVKEQLALLKELIFYPLGDDNNFDEQSFKEAKENALFEIASRNDQPDRYALSQALKIYGEDSPLAIDDYGDGEVIKEIENHNLYLWYRELIVNCYREIMVVGEVDESLIIDFASDFLVNSEKSMNVTYLRKPSTLKEVVEVGNIDQSQMVMIFSSPFNLANDNYYKLAVGNALFGQLPTSLLFQEVREKRSLCYSVGSRLLAYEGGLLVKTGMDKKNLASTKELIVELLNQVKNGEFSLELLQMAKDMLIDSLKTSFDYQSGFINQAFKIMHVNKELTLEKTIELINAVSVKDVLETFKELQLETVYIYQQGENEKNS